MAQQGGRLDNYVTVAERVGAFYQAHPAGRINTEIVNHDAESGFILMKAFVYRSTDDAEPSATGHAFEVRAESYVNKTSYIENAETSAVGRALALLNFETHRGLQTRGGGEQQQPQAKPQPRQPQPAKADAPPAQQQQQKKQAEKKPAADPEREAEARRIVESQHGVEHDEEMGRYVVWDGKKKFAVHRDDRGRILCDCDDFAGSADESFRCEHILAVKLFIAKNQQQQQAPPARPKSAPAPAAETPGVSKGYKTPKISEVRKNPEPRHAADYITPRQIKMAEGLAEELGIDADEECQRVLKQNVSDLSKKAGSAFIAHLQAGAPEEAE